MSFPTVHAVMLLQDSTRRLSPELRVRKVVYVAAKNRRSAMSLADFKNRGWSAVRAELYSAFQSDEPFQGIAEGVGL